MAAFTWIQMSSLLILMLQFKGTTEQNQTVQTVTAGRGHDVTLPCKNAIQENKRQCGNNTGLSLNPADTQSGPGSSQDTADADDGVSYVSISFTKKSKNKSRSRGDDDEGDTVTYSTVKASSSPARVSTDPNNLYSTINYPRK
ncbi:uncharacterized protein LOC120433257 isoform X2 [Oreochromis aureus]|uniref:uncharacterized protein LOC120433257 isoform X2 n=1 Tax=Oreochromis aureus TaxID=47969 RepID=UPI0019547BAE|nr:uncharacterized protein LOC120433257 isoform X2 [Oreochromis aureus]